jgi:carbamoyltransferase
MQKGRVTAAAQEERFLRRKNAPDFPVRALNYCLQAGGRTLRDIDAAVFYEKPFLKLSRVLISHLQAFPRSFGKFRRSLPHWLDERLFLPLKLKELGLAGDVLFVKHHLSHAASAFFPSPFEEAAVLTMDAVGEWAVATRGAGRGNKIRVDEEMLFPDSLGLLYTAVTTFLGFKAHEGEGTVMGLAALGKPAFLDRLREVVAASPDGGFSPDPAFFDFSGGEKMYTPRFVQAFGPERSPGAALDERHCDLAASLQVLTEDILVRIARDLRARGTSENLCLAGGVFLNCSANQKILERSGFKRLFVQPAAGDAGGALGAAAFVSHSLWDLPRTGGMDPYLGPEFSKSRAAKALTRAGLPFRELSEDELCAWSADKLAQGKILGWMQGRMEIGPRALGNRSILADPRNPGMKKILNERVKAREEFRPYAPAVLAEHAGEYFEMDAPSSFMLLAPRVRDEKQAVIPAVTHADGTARVQTVKDDANPLFCRLLRAFRDLTGVPVLINTSFNRRGEPIACSPEDAVDCFTASRMDCLAIGGLVTER